MVDSAQLSPQLKPKWYARGRVITNSPAHCVSEQLATPLAASTAGEISVALCRRKLLHPACSRGNDCAASISTWSAARGGQPTQLLGAPEWRKLMEKRSASCERACMNVDDGSQQPRA